MIQDSDGSWYGVQKKEIGQFCLQGNVGMWNLERLLEEIALAELS